MRRTAAASTTTLTSSLTPLRTMKVRRPPMTIISSIIGSSRSSARYPYRTGSEVTVIVVHLPKPQHV